jgi:hypothetical protein
MTDDLTEEWSGGGVKIMSHMFALAAIKLSAAEI